MDAVSSNEYDWYEAVARWSRVCEMGMEAALREAGCSEQSIRNTGTRLGFEGSQIILRNVWELVDTDAGKAALLATLGRGITRVDAILANADENLQFTEDHAAALMVNISSNTTVTTLELSYIKMFGTVKGCTLLGRALASNFSITNLDLGFVLMGCESLKCLLHRLESNTELEILRLDGNDLSGDGMKVLAEMFRNNTTLKNVSLLCQTNTGNSKHIAEAAIAMALALGTNVFLHTLGLDVRAMREKDMERLLQPLSGGAHYPKNTSLTNLRLDNVSHQHVECISHMISTNTSLHYLSLLTLSAGQEEVALPFRPTDWKDHIFPALGDNKTLKQLRLTGSTGLTGEEVFKSLMDVLQNTNTTLQRIYLDDTDMESCQGQVNEELRINRDYRHQLTYEPRSAISFGRIVLCGYGFAGKSEIAKTMKQIEEKAWWPRSWKTGFTKLAQKVTGEAYKQWVERTRGFQVITLNKQPYVKSIWDFAGQKEYYALHDYVFPDSKNSHFLYVCSCRFPPDDLGRAGQVKDKESIRRECEFWMRFLASNSKPVRTVDGQKLPRVSFVLTKTDTLDRPQKIISMVDDVVGELREVFKHALNLSRTVEVVDSRSPEPVKRLLIRCNDNLEQILEKQKEYDICQELRNLLQIWSTTNPKKPVLRLDEFHTLCSKQKNLETFSEEARKLFLAYLNDLGEIIFPPQSKFIVTNPTWFGIDVLGSLIDAFQGRDLPTFELYHEQGFVTREAMIKHLENSLESMDLKQSIPPEELIDLMLKLELCFEIELDEKKRKKRKRGFNSSFFVPAIFDDKKEVAANGRRKLEWKLKDRSGCFQYLGRRLECQDRSTTFLTPGFFPRLQIYVRNYIDERNWTKNPVFEVGRNLIRFANNGIEVCVENDNDNFIDILVRSSAPIDMALKFIQKHVVQTIRAFCASPQGCQGVVLVESIIRPVCVQKLHLCIDRKPHSVLVSYLEDKLLENEAYKHIWSSSIDLESDVVLARDLLIEKNAVTGKRGGKHLSLGTSSSTAPSRDDFPGHFYASVGDLLNATEQLSELVREFIAEIMKGDEGGFIVSVEWLYNLEEHEKEVLMSVLSGTGYSKVYHTTTTILYQRLDQDNVETSNVTVCSDLASAGFMKKPLEEEIRSSILDTDREANTHSNLSTLKGEEELTVEQVSTRMRSCIAALNEKGCRSYCVSTEWLSNLQSYEKEMLESVCRETGFMKTYRNDSTTYYERVGDHVRTCNDGSGSDAKNDSSRPLDCPSTSGAYTEGGELDPKGLQSLNVHDGLNSPPLISVATEPRPNSPHRECISQRFRVSYTPLPRSQTGASTSSSQDGWGTSTAVDSQHSEGEFRHSVRELCGDNYVILPKLYRSKQDYRTISTTVEKLIEIEGFEYRGTTELIAVPINLKAVIGTTVSCCLKNDPNRKTVRVKFSKIRGEVQYWDNRKPEVMDLVLQSVYISVDAIIKPDDDESIELSLCRPRCIMNRTDNDNGDTVNEVWVELSDIDLEGSEPGSITLELKCDERKRRHNRRDLGLRFQDSTDPVMLEGDICRPFDRESVLELEIRFRLRLSMSRPCQPSGLPFCRTKIAYENIDFDCRLELTSTVGLNIRESAGLNIRQRILSWYNFFMEV